MLFFEHGEVMRDGSTAEMLMAVMGVTLCLSQGEPQASIEDCFEILGRVAYESIAAVKRASESFHCSYSEFQKHPTKMFEYWACGLPVVASNLPPTGYSAGWSSASCGSDGASHCWNAREVASGSAEGRVMGAKAQTQCG